MDVVSVLTESADGRKYWNKLKQRLREEGNETVTNCRRLKITATDGKKRLTDDISRAWSDMSTREYKNLKGLRKENLRDNMTTLELVLSMLAEATTTSFSKLEQPGV